MSPSPRRTVHHADAIAWLEASGVLDGVSVVTSLPDVSEVSPGRPDAWRAFFARAVTLCVTRADPRGVAVFHQTDVRHDGAWLDKGALVVAAAEATGARLLWHKIVCRVAPGTTTRGRAGYSHLVCVSRGAVESLAGATPDVLPAAGDTTWARGMGTASCALACRFVLAQTPTRTILDPFCGHGTVLAVANALGLDAVGVELGGKRARRARTLEARVEGDRVVLANALTRGRTG